MCSRVLVAGALLALGSGSVPAAAEIAVAEGQTVCFGQSYSWEELEAAPSRRAARLELSLTNWDGDLVFGFDVIFNDRWGLVFGGGGSCHARDAGYMCAIDGDGGVLMVSPIDNGSVDVRTDEYGMTLYSAAYDDETTIETYGEYHPDGLESFLTSADTIAVHNLVPLPADYCN